MDSGRLSRFLSRLLRHEPGRIGLTLDAGGWVSVEEIIARAGFPLSRDEISEVVRTSDKQRFALSPDGNRIRANQGHSIHVDLGLVPIEPPDTLFHGTAERTAPAILAEGLSPMGRQYVHLSPDHNTAIKVGRRHGPPVVLVIAARRLSENGGVFYLSENKVWLTGNVPPDYIKAVTS